MNSLKMSTRLRALSVWSIGTVALAALLQWLSRDLASSGPAMSFEDALERACLVVIGLCGVWAWLVVGVVVVEVLRSRTVGTDRTPGIPPWARGLVLMTCGVAAIGLAAPANADADLDGLPMPDRATGGFLSDSVRPLLQAGHRTTPTTAPQAPRAPQHVVSSGDSLWSIAEAELGNAARWPEIYRLNRAAIGPDPDFIDVAQQLDLPR